MTEDIIRANIDESLFYFRKCRKRHKIFNILYIPFLILTICFIAFLVFVYAKLYFEAFDLALNFHTSEQVINYLTRKYSLLLMIYSIISYVTIFTLTGAIVFGTFTKLNKKAYKRNENKIYTLKKDLKQLKEKSHS